MLFYKDFNSQDLTNLAIALATAINAGLMSREEATVTFKKALIELGIKKVTFKNEQKPVSEAKKEEATIKSSKGEK